MLSVAGFRRTCADIPNTLVTAVFKPTSAVVPDTFTPRLQSSPSRVRRTPSLSRSLNDSLQAHRIQSAPTRSALTPSIQRQLATTSNPSQCCSFARASHQLTANPPPSSRVEASALRPHD
jgi:hypothetical protein